ncbi:hypothetical protein [Alicyclobacillus sp. ALC3]|uniref:hypothetical protein n=1 Tax=Alicyclobacillus sp. ALC3 TaxID=2796143 RepID=UPI00237860E4|nr:hypothetical protein [Alicyclobacillus sp. ALC3]WDL95385.1 hypothetical protein JC200_13295 [Alicyclobacillus sp. ALC3]
MRMRPIGTALALVVSLTLTGCTQTAGASKVMVVNAIDSHVSNRATAPSTAAGFAVPHVPGASGASGQRAFHATAVGMGGPFAVTSGSAHVGTTYARMLLRPGGLPGSRLSGDATFVLSSKTHDLTVTLRLSGLVPGVRYRAAITDPSGRVLSNLAPVAAARGKPDQGSSVTLIRHVVVIQPSWRVVIDQV